MDVIGGGLLVAVAAALWIAYLLPNWLRRRQYLATERNAVRLQQTLRILAETAETPEPVRVEATAREVAAQQRILQQREATARLTAEAEEREALAERWAAEGAVDAARLRVGIVLAAAAAATEPITIVAPAEGPEAAPAPARPSMSAVARKRLRRGRAVCSLVLLVSVLIVIAGGIATAFGASLVVPVIGAVGIALAFAGLVRLARVRPAAPVVARPAAAVEAQPFEPIDLVEPESTADDGWVPQPLPRPLHLSRGTIAAMAMASIDAAAELKRAEVGDDIARRAAELEPELPVITPAAPAATAPRSRPTTAVVHDDAPASPYARMGIIDDARPGFEDLDAVLRRRRQAG
ncbi:hypothetical protein ASE14_14590 [Agromyces sp. Root81]|uniref:hypothetical protein n=1 Tax=Agromyces sp. Root81 TaxID=1736601 RepID=UPI0006F20E2F|nr:hypothetical protein [Agromyces sp. Root81]KRC59025.1 hypothetical protein ASE14_14590 [Agromyces sp. Root81]